MHLTAEARAAQQMVGIGEMRISNDPQAILTAPNLGSCLGIAMYDPKLKLGALIHCLLPYSGSSPEKAKAQPCLYVDTGVVQMLSELKQRGATIKDLRIYVSGGSNINDENNVFEIGKKNYTILRKVLWKNNLLIHGEHIGDKISRTVSLYIANGEVWVRASGETFKL